MPDEEREEVQEWIDVNGVGWAKMHKTLTTCPYCEENISSLFFNTKGGVMTKLKGFGICKKCNHIYKIKIEEIVEQTITESSFKFKAKQDKLKIAQELLKQLELEGLIWKELYTILIAKEYALQKKEIARKQTEEMVVVMFLSF